MSKKIIRIEGCYDCPFTNDYMYSEIGTNPTCNISNNKEIDLIKAVNNREYRSDYCELNKWDTIEIEL